MGWWVTERHRYQAAIHEAGHGFIELVSDPYQDVRLEIDLQTAGGWVYSSKCAMGTMGGMAAQLAFGEFWSEALRGSAQDIKDFERRWPDRDWRVVLQKSMRLIEGYRLEVAAIALLLRGYRTVTQEECLACMLDPLGTVRQHAARLAAGRLF